MTPALVDELIEWARKVELEAGVRASVVVELPCDAFDRVMVVTAARAPVAYDLAAAEFTYGQVTFVRSMPTWRRRRRGRR